VDACIETTCMCLDLECKNSLLRAYFSRLLYTSLVIQLIEILSGSRSARQSKRRGRRKASRAPSASCREGARRGARENEGRRKAQTRASQTRQKRASCQGNDGPPKLAFLIGTWDVGFERSISIAHLCTSRSIVIWFLR